MRRFLHAPSLIAILLAAPSLAAATIVEPAPGYRVVDQLTGSGGTAEVWPAAMAVVDGSLVAFENRVGLQRFDLTSGSLEEDWGEPGDGYAYWSASFVTPEPDGSAYWVGFTTPRNADDRIYRVAWTPDEGVKWVHKATLRGNFDLEFDSRQTENELYAYVSANPSAAGISSPPDNRIYRANAKNASSEGKVSFDAIVDVLGYSAGLAVDARGDLYYGTWFSAAESNRMYRFTANEIAAAAASGQPIVPSDAANRLFDLQVGALDTEVDDAGRIVFASAGNESWDGLVGLADADPGGFSPVAATWSCYDRLAALAVSGDLSGASGRVFVAEYFQPGVAEISPLPPGDANGDGLVDKADASILAAHWLQGAGAAWGDGDFNRDGAVDDLDLAILAANWQPGPGGTSVPEPSVAVLLAGVLAALWRGRMGVGGTVRDCDFLTTG
ncbi:MAG: hypothetical protein JW809_11315 [Pirellulales bacterium]|nr:hypothetical protein [Pirellulales bacterium]